VTTQEVPAQKASWAAASAYPPRLRTPMFLVALSDERRTWYRLPLYED
jgi:hypothetical protein